MKIIVDCLPETKADCLFSEWDCEYGWICKLYNPKRLGLGSYDCCPETCPYLREESWIGETI